VDSDVCLAVRALSALDGYAGRTDKCYRRAPPYAPRCRARACCCRLLHACAPLPQQPRRAAGCGGRDLNKPYSPPGTQHRAAHRTACRAHARRKNYRATGQHLLPATAQKRYLIGAAHHSSHRVLPRYAARCFFCLFASISPLRRMQTIWLDESGLTCCFRRKHTATRRTSSGAAWRWTVTALLGDIAAPVASSSTLICGDGQRKHVCVYAVWWRRYSRTAPAALARASADNAAILFNVRSSVRRDCYLQAYWTFRWVDIVVTSCGLVRHGGSSAERLRLWTWLWNSALSAFASPPSNIAATTL